MGHHLLIKVGNGVKGEILVVDHAGPSEGLKTLVVEGIIGKGSKVRVESIHIHSPKHATYSQLMFKVGERSEVKARCLVIGGAMSRLQVDYVLEGYGSNADLKASGLARRGTKTDMILNVINVGERTTGFTGSRGVVLSGGYLALRGLAKITQTAKWASSEVESKITILGDDAKGYAVPILEIFSGDVTKAAHSAAVSNILEDHIFYLKSRGLSQDEIELLLVSGMLAYSEITEKYGLDPIKLAKLS
jgi:Fe-S cluster assembly scaffold protein SufB